jgi:hypothetical protein
VGKVFYDKNPEKTDAGADSDCVEGLGLQDAPAQLQQKVLGFDQPVQTRHQLAHLQPRQYLAEWAYRKA